MAHYLHPIMVKQFLITAPDNKTVENSPIYQNPYWPIVPDMPAENKFEGIPIIKYWSALIT